MILCLSDKYLLLLCNCHCLPLHLITPSVIKTQRKRDTFISQLNYLVTEKRKQCSLGVGDQGTRIYLRWVLDLGLIACIQLKNISGFLFGFCSAHWVFEMAGLGNWREGRLWLGDTTEAEHVFRYHTHELLQNQCSSHLVRYIKAPVHLVWSIVRTFDKPQKYKPFVHSCSTRGDIRVGSIRNVNVKTGLPATASTERLEILDDNERILSVKILGGDHRLHNYSSTVTVHPEVIDGRPGTMVIESYVVDVPEGNTQEETHFFVEALVKCNLKSLADVAERLASQHDTELLDRA